jgi:hypothetical protein
MYLRGDFNGDGRVDIYDALALTAMLDGESSPLETEMADANGDGVIDNYDVLAILEHVSGNTIIDEVFIY